MILERLGACCVVALLGGFVHHTSPGDGWAVFVTFLLSFIATGQKWRG